MFSIIPAQLRRQSMPRLVITVIAGFAGALCSAEIARLIGQVAAGQIETRGLVIVFFAVCAAQLLFRTSSQIIVLDFGQQVICSLRIELCRKILRTPYKKLQSLGKPRLLAILTTDINTFAQASQMLPLAFGNVVLIVVCLVYMAWLSWQAFACFFVFLVVGGRSITVSNAGPCAKCKRCEISSMSSSGTFVPCLKARGNCNSTTREPDTSPNTSSIRPHTHSADRSPARCSSIRSSPTPVACSSMWRSA